MLRILVPVFFIFASLQLQANQSKSFFQNYHKAQDVILNSGVDLHDAKVALLDISFFGYELLLKDHLSQDLESVESSIASPHGTGVAQVLLHPFQSKLREQVKFSYLGLIGWDISLETHLQRILDKGIRIVNISYFLKDKKDIETLNKFIDKGLMVVISAGNSADRHGIEVFDHYKNFKGLIASSLNQQGKLAAFSHSCSDCLHVPGGYKQYQTQYLNHTKFDKRKGEPQQSDLDAEAVKFVDVDFGMTSSASPMVASILAMTVMLCPDIEMSYVKQKFIESSDQNNFLNKVNVYSYLGLIQSCE